MISTIEKVLLTILSALLVLVIVGALAVALGGCSLFTSSTVANATALAIEKAAQYVEKQSGKSLDDLPTECDVESVPDKGEVLILCTIHTDGAK